MGGTLLHVMAEGETSTLPLLVAKVNPCQSWPHEVTRFQVPHMELGRVLAIFNIDLAVVAVYKLDSLSFTMKLPKTARTNRDCIRLDADQIWPEQMHARLPYGLASVGSLFASEQSSEPVKKKKLIIGSDRTERVVWWRETLRDCLPSNIYAPIDSTRGQRGQPFPGSTMFAQLASIAQTGGAAAGSEIVWMWIQDDKTSRAYPTAICAKLEKAREAGEPIVDVSEIGDWEIDLNRMVQVVKSDPERWRQVTRQRRDPENGEAQSPQPSVELEPQPEPEEEWVQVDKAASHMPELLSPNSTHFVCFKAVLRAGVETTSEDRGILYEGEELQALEKSQFLTEAGVMVKRIRSARGWCSLKASDGEPLLQSCGTRAPRHPVIPGRQAVEDLLPCLLSKVSIQQLRGTGGGVAHEGWLRSEKLGRRGKPSGEWEHWYCALWPAQSISEVGRLLVYFHHPSDNETATIREMCATGAISLRDSTMQNPKENRSGDYPYCFRLNASRLVKWDCSKATAQDRCVTSKQKFILASEWPRAVQPWREALARECFEPEPDSTSTVQVEPPAPDLGQLWIPFGELSFKQAIGNGAYGTVYEGDRCGPVAIKTIPRKEGQSKPTQVLEYETAQKLAHDNILQVFGVSSGCPPLAPGTLSLWFRVGFLSILGYQSADIDRLAW